MDWHSKLSKIIEEPRANLQHRELMECKYIFFLKVNIVLFRLGAQKANQTFFMADRMRKQGGGSNVMGGNRPLSIDEMNST